MNDNHNSPYRCFLYAMIADPGDSEVRYFKIGISSEVGPRIASIQCGCPMPITQVLTTACRSRDSAYRCEQRMHALLAEYRSSGEWFRFDMSNPTHKAAFHAAAKTTLDHELLPGWRWELAEMEDYREWKAEQRPAPIPDATRKTIVHAYRLAKGLPMW